MAECYLYRGKQYSSKEEVLKAVYVFDLTEEAKKLLGNKSSSFSSKFIQSENKPIDVSQSTTVEPVSKAEEIYNMLGNKTQSANVVIEPVYQQAGVQYAKSIGGLFSLRLNNSDKHFGNPFSSDENLVKKDNLIQTKSIKESVERYIDWVINSKEDRAKWIREQLYSGKLKNKPIVYYKDLKEPSHATALDFLINDPKSPFNQQGSTQSISDTTSQTQKDSSTEDLKISSMSELTNHSGGAYGGDTFWDLIGREFGVTEHKHYRDSNNINLSKKLKDKGVIAAILTKNQMNNARTQVETLLSKKYPDTTEGNLQVRNYYQVANSDGVFAVATLTSNKTGVTGGTNTAVQLGIKLNKPVYVWDITTEQWYKFDNGIFTQTETPTLTKNFAGVGSRDIESYNVQDKSTGEWVPRKEYKGLEKETKAKQAIKDVYEKTKNSVNKNTQSTQSLVENVEQTKNQKVSSEINNYIVSKINELQALDKINTQQIIDRLKSENENLNNLNQALKDAIDSIIIEFKC